MDNSHGGLWNSDLLSAIHIDDDVVNSIRQHEIFELRVEVFLNQRSKKVQRWPSGLRSSRNLHNSLQSKRSDIFKILGHRKATAVNSAWNDSSKIDRLPVDSLINGIVGCLEALGDWRTELA